MIYELPPLPYDYTALEPYIDTTTMHLHHEQHHKTYVTKLNDAVAASNEMKTMDLHQLMSKISTLPVAVRNNGGGHYNHSLFWTLFAPVGTSNTRPTGALAEAIDSNFGSLDNFKKEFTSAALNRFGSGWAWLSHDPASGKLQVSSTANQDNPLMDVAEVKGLPVLGLDVWEHAYYLKYQNRRAEYIQQYWSVVNWDVASGYYEKVKSTKNPIIFNKM